jgi:uncharacterized protein
MTNFKRIGFAVATAAVLALSPTTSSAQKKTLKMNTVAPGSTMYNVMTTFANIVNKTQNGLEITVDATGAATKHMIDVGRGTTDIALTAPPIYFFMQKGKAMYAKTKDAPEISKNLKVLFWFPLGGLHFTTYDDSGIKSLMDIKGKRVWLGPPGGGQTRTAAAFIGALTGYKAGKDFKKVNAGFQSAIQSFQDRQLDVYTIGCLDPCAQLQQVAATRKIRFLGASEKVESAAIKKVMSIPGQGRGWTSVKKDAYGASQVNKTDVWTVDAKLGITVRAGLDENDVYNMVKSFWSNIDDIRASAPYMRGVKLDFATRKLNMPFHSGAAKYYKEIGKH